MPEDGVEEDGCGGEGEEGGEWRDAIEIELLDEGG